MTKPRLLPMILALAFLALASIGCANVTSTLPGQTTATGESWYTKSTWFLFIPLGTDIYYCPPNEGTCYEAEIRE